MLVGQVCNLSGVGRRGRNHAVLPHRAKVRAVIAANWLITDVGHWSLHIFTLPRSGRVGRGSGRGGLVAVMRRPILLISRRPSPGLRARLSRKRESNF